MAQRDQLSFGGKSVPASQQKSGPSQSRAWNFIQWDNNREISRSLIQKLPGDQNFMGNHIQIVCLLQAAQIQRLCKNLQDFKSRYKEIGKGTLDRHSYEIQIKQLSQIIQSVKNENRKLKQFAVKQQRKLSQYHSREKQTNDSDKVKSIEAKYQRALTQIQKMLSDNKQLQQTVNSLVKENQKLQIQERGNSQMYKIKLKRIKEQFQQNQKTTPKKDLNRQLKMLEDQRQASLNKISSLTQTLQFYELRNDKSRKDLQAMNTLAHEKEQQSKQFKSKLRQYENKVALLSQEIERLIQVANQKQNNMRNMKNELQHMQEKVTNSQIYIQQLEKIIQIEQTNTSQGNKNQIQTAYKIRQMSLKIKQLESQNRRKTSILDDNQNNMDAIGASIQESSKSFKLLSIEKNRLFQSLKQAQQKVKMVIKDNQKLKETLSIRQAKIKQLFGAIEHINKQNVQIQHENSILREKVHSLDKSQQGFKLQLNQHIKQANNQIYQLQERFSQSQSKNQQIKQLYNHITAKAQHAINQNINLLKVIDQKDGDLQRLRRKIQELSQDRQQNSKNTVFESILKQTERTYRQLCDKNSQCEKLVMQLKQVYLINSSLEAQVRQVKQSLIKMIEQQRKLRQKAQNQVKFHRTKQFQMLLNKILGQINNIKILNQQNIAKTGQIQSQVSLQLKKLTNESKAIKRESALKDIQQIERLNRLLIEKQKNIANLNNQVSFRQQIGQNDPLSKQLTAKIIQITKQNVSLKKQIESINIQNEGKAETYEKRIIQLKSVIEKQNYQVKDGHSKDMQSLSNQLHAKDKQLESMSSALKQAKEQLEASINQHSQLHTYKNRCEQLGKQVRMYQAELRSLKQQKEETKRTGQQLYSIRSTLQSQLEHRNQQIKCLYQKISYLQLDKISQERTQRTFQDYQRHIRQARNQILSLQNTIAQQKEQFQMINQEKHRLKLNLENNLREQMQTCRQIQKIQEKTSKLQQASERVAQLDKENRNLLNIIRKKNKEIKNLQIAGRKLQDQVSYMKTFKNALSLQVQRLNEQIATTYDKIRQLKEQIEQRSQFSLQIVQTLQTMTIKVGQMQRQVGNIHALRNKILEIEQQKWQYMGQARQFQIEKISLSQQSSKFLKTIKIHEQKLALLTQQFGQMEDIIYKLKKQNAVLRSQNYDINIQNEKSKTLQNKIKVLNDEIDRVQHQKEDLFQQVTTCRFSIAQQIDSSKRIQQQLSVIMLLSIQVESLRLMLQTKENMIKELRQCLVDPKVILKAKAE